MFKLTVDARDRTIDAAMPYVTRSAFAAEPACMQDIASTSVPIR